MSTNQVTCTGCKTVLKTANPMQPGTKIKCPKCANVFAVPGPAGAPAAAPRPSAVQTRPPAANPAAAPRPSAVQTKPPAAAPRPSAVQTRPSAPSPAAAPNVPKTPRPKSLFARLPRKLRKLMVQGMVAATLFGLLIYGLVFLAVSYAFESAVASLTKPSEDKTGGATAVAKLPPKPIDTTYIIPEFNSVAVLHPARTLKSSLLEGLPIENMSKEMVEKAGVGMDKVEQIVLLGEPYPAGKPRANTPQPIAWQSFSTKHGRFTATLPGKPLLSGGEYTVLVSDGKVLPPGSLSFGKEPRFKNIVTYRVGVHEVNPGRLAAGVKQYLDQKVAAGKNIDLAGNPGKEEDVDDILGGSDRHVFQRVYLVGQREYTVSVTAPRDVFHAEDARKFADSFKLLSETGSESDEMEFADDEVPVFVAGIVRFQDSVDARAVLKKGIEKEDKLVNYQGHEYYRDAKQRFAGIPGVVAAPDEHTLIYGPETTVRKMLTEGGKVASPLIDRLERLDLKADVSVIIVATPYQSLLDDTAERVKKITAPFDIHELGGPMNKISAVYGYMNIDSDPLLKVVLETDSATTAAELDTAFVAAIDRGKGLWSFAKLTMVANLPPDLKQPSIKMVDSLMKKIQTAHADKETTLTILKPDGLKELLDVGKKMFPNMGQPAQQRFNNVGQRIGGPDIEKK